MEHKGIARAIQSRVWRCLQNTEDIEKLGLYMGGPLFEMTGNAIACMSKEGG